MNEEFTPPDPFSSDDPVPDRAVVSDAESSDESDAEDDASSTSPEGDGTPREPMGLLKIPILCLELVTR